jgi:hypothetical protein
VAQNRAHTIDQRPFIHWILAFCLLCLSVAVFNWGLQYKMSLYQNIDGSTHAPAAKLLTGKSVVSVEEIKAPLHEHVPHLIEAVFLIFFLAHYLALRAGSALQTFVRWRDLSNHAQVRLTLYARSFFFRPPPTYV